VITGKEKGVSKLVMGKYYRVSNVVTEERGVSNIDCSLYHIE
jgi:hypothetical protein